MMVRYAAVLVVAFCSAMAADVTGNWTGQLGEPGGDGPTIVCHFKQDGTKLTGTVEGPQGDPLQIAEGKIEGDKISFSVTVEFGGNGPMKILHEGTVNGDEIKLATKHEGGADGPGPLTLKRSKS
jgi:hypothetical protein